MITSLFENNKDLDICVYVLTDTQLSKGAKNQFKQLSCKYSQRIEIIEVDKSQFENYPTKNMSYWTIAMYYRLLAQELMPIYVSRILYLDCDIIIDGSLRNLKEVNMDGFALAAVDDICCFDKGDTNIRLNYPCSYSYFNSGVLLINLDYWREHNIQKQCLDYLFENYDILSANDQDVLNAVLHDKTQLLTITFNYQVLFRKKDLYINYDESLQRLIDNTDKPLIIHYAMQTKPWDIRYYRLPFGKVWKKYKRCSPWRYYLPFIPRKNKVTHLINRYILWPLGIMRNWQGYGFI